MCQAVRSLNTGKNWMQIVSPTGTSRQWLPRLAYVRWKRQRRVPPCVISGIHILDQFCPRVSPPPPHCSRRKSSCSRSVLTEPNLALVIVTEQLPDVHRGEGNNRDVLALSPRCALCPDLRQESRNGLQRSAAADTLWPVAPDICGRLPLL